MIQYEYLLGLLATICLGLSAWALKKVSAHESALATLQSKIVDADRLTGTLGEVRDAVLLMRQTNDGLLARFQAFEVRYDERSTRTAELANTLDKRVALIELYLKWHDQGPREAPPNA